MSRTTRLARRFRPRAESDFDTTIVFKRVTGSTWDEGTLTETPTTSTVYDDVCQVRPMSLQDREVLFGDRAVSVSAYTVKVKHDADIERGDVGTVSASADPRMVDAVFTVRDAPLDEWVVVRPLVCERVE